MRRFLNKHIRFNTENEIVDVIMLLNKHCSTSFVPKEFLECNKEVLLHNKNSRRGRYCMTIVPSLYRAREFRHGWEIYNENYPFIEAQEFIDILWNE